MILTILHDIYGLLNVGALYSSSCSGDFGTREMLGISTIQESECKYNKSGKIAVLSFYLHSNIHT